MRWNKKKKSFFFFYITEKNTCKKHRPFTFEGHTYFYLFDFIQGGNLLDIENCWHMTLNLKYKYIKDIMTQCMVYWHIQRSEPSAIIFQDYFKISTFGLLLLQCHPGLIDDKHRLIHLFHLAAGIIFDFSK